jgi:hypothetical protein
MRAIDGDRLKRKAQKEATEAWKMRTEAKVETILNQFIDWIDEAPTIEPERKRGEWMDYTEDGYVECPFCHSATNCDGNKEELHFCFSCGADMRGEEDETD